MFEEREMVMIWNKISDSGHKETACGDGTSCANPVKTEDQDVIRKKTTCK